MSALADVAKPMTVEEFLSWEAPHEARWELVERRPVAMAPAERTREAIQAELTGLIRNALVEKGSPCSALATPGVVPGASVRSLISTRPISASSAAARRRNSSVRRSRFC